MLFKGNSSRLEFLIEKIQAHKESPSPIPSDDKCVLKSKDGLLSNGTYSWRSDDDSVICQRGGGTPSSCATSTSMSFASEPEADIESRTNIDTGISSGPYSCQFCEKSFPSLSYLKKHEQNHGDQMPYRCSWCARLFKHKRSRDRHVKLHTGDRRYRCTQCEAAFSRSDHLKIHMKTHDNQKPYHCSECSRGYNTAAALTSHMQSHKRPQSTSATSQISSKAALEERRSSSWHSATSSPSVSSPIAAIAVSQNPASPSDILRSSLTLACMYCAQDTFTSMDQLQSHVHTAHEAILNGSSHSPVDQASRCRPVNGESGFSCRQCPLKFAKASALRDHLTSEHEATLTCPLCGIPCSSAANYAEHYVLEHCNNRSVVNHLAEGGWSASRSRDSRQSLSETRKYENSDYSSTTLLCGQCGAALQDFESFREHVARHLQGNHQRKYAIQCPKCSMAFHARDDMLRHLIKHFLGQEVKQYSCEACNKSFSDSELLHEHLMDAHAQQVYRCAACRDIFDSRAAIQLHFTVKHTREATVYRCSGCSDEKSRGNDCEGISVFKNATEMMEHVVSVHAQELAPRRNHEDEEDEDEVDSPGNSVSTPRVIGEFFRCCFCGMFCNSELDLQRHLATHSTCFFRCPICHEGFPVEFLLDKHIAHSHNIADSEHAMTNNQKGYCRSKSQEDTVRSKRRHSPEVKINSTQPDNTTHSMFRPTSKRPSSQHCDLCERSDFPTEAELRAHKKLIHKSPSKLQAKQQSLQVCNYCGETLKSRLDLEAHTRLHHAPSEPGKRYKCNICDEVFSSGVFLAQHKLQQHCKIQLSNVCTVCRAGLTTEFDFVQHVQKHSLEAVDPQQRLDSMLTHIPAHCVVCRQTLISEFECQLHAKFHLKPPEEAQSSDHPPQSCCICLREFQAEDDAVSLTSKCEGISDQRLKVCKRCYSRHSQGLPILGCHDEQEVTKAAVKFEGIEDAHSTAQLGHRLVAIHGNKRTISPVNVQETSERAAAHIQNNQPSNNVIVKEEVVVNPGENEDIFNDSNSNIQEQSEPDYLNEDDDCDVDDNDDEMKPQILD